VLEFQFFSFSKNGLTVGHPHVACLTNLFRLRRHPAFESKNNLLNPALLHPVTIQPLSFSVRLAMGCVKFTRLKCKSQACPMIGAFLRKKLTHFQRRS
jgi:hypothetical protein